MTTATKLVTIRELNPLPSNAAELAKCLSDPIWRITSGCLYKIMIKGDDKSDAERDGLVMPFVPNKAQRRFIKRLYHRNIILKARQLGFTTLIAILWLDHALFNGNQRCAMIAQDRDTVESIFRDKVKFAYDNLPVEIRERFPLARDSASELLFAHNNSSVKVATSVRGGTIHRLHISEFGKICAHYPEKAVEVKTGSIPAVPSTGIIVIESTAEGRAGEFFVMTQIAQKNYFTRKKLTPRDYRLHFYAWWQEENYRLDSRLVDMSIDDHKYFDDVEAIVKRDMGIDMRLDPDQRAWYVATRDADFSSEPEKMWQEYPSFPDEAFQLSTEGNYYARDMLELRRRGGVCDVPELDLPVNTFWDIGNSDGCAIWFHQEFGGQDRWINYYEAHGETLRHYVQHLRSLGYVLGVNYLPHDAAHARLSDTNQSTVEMLEELMPDAVFVVLPRISQLITGIRQTRSALKHYYFDKTACAKGIERLENYKKRFNRSEMRYIDEPNKANGCSEAADAIRQHAQAKAAGLLITPSQQRRGRYKPAASPDWRTI